MACHERKRSAAAPFVNCITLLGHIAILNLRLFSFKLSVSPVLRKLARLIASTRKYYERYIYIYIYTYIYIYIYIRIYIYVQDLYHCHSLSELKVPLEHFRIDMLHVS